MKKALFKILSLILALTLMSLVFVSCDYKKEKEENSLMKLDEDERAIAVYKRADENMSAATSYNSTSEMDFSFSISGVMYNIEGNAYETYCMDTPTGLYHVTETTMYMNTQGASEKEENSYVNGYYDGKMFTNEDGSARYDNISPEEYIEYTKEESVIDITDIDYELCGKKKCTKNSDSTWEVEFCEFDRDSLLPFNEYLTTLSGVFDTNIEDVQIKMSISDDFYINEASIVFVFMDDHSGTVLSIKSTFSNINAVDKDNLNIVDLSEYQHIPNFPAISKTQSAIQNTSISKAISFEVSVYETIKQNNYSISSITTFKGEFHNDATQGISFNYTQTKDDTKDYYVFEYSKGVLTITLKGSDGTVKDKSQQSTTYSEANNVIMSFVDPMKFQSLDIYSAEKYTKNYFDFDIDNSSPTFIDTAYTAVHGTSSNLEVKLKDNILSNYEYKAYGNSDIGAISVEIRIIGEFAVISSSDNM